MNEWISVDVELPEQGEHIFFTRCGDCGVPIVVYGYRLGGSWQDQMHNIRVRTNDVLQWQYMPLPEPPSQERIDGPFYAIRFEGCQERLAFSAPLFNEYVGRLTRSATLLDANADLVDLVKWLNNLWHQFSH